MTFPPALGRLSIRLYALITLCGLALTAVAGFALWSQWQDAHAERIAQLQALTEVAAKVVDANRALALSGAMTEEAAKARSESQIIAMTYGNNDYMWLIDVATGRYIAHPDMKKIGTDAMSVQDVTGFRYSADVLPRAIRDGVASVAYRYPRLGSTEPLPKISVYRHYVPWNWAIGAGGYVDDIRAVFWRSARWMVLVIAGTVLAIMAVGALLVRSVTKPTAALQHAMRALAAGELHVMVPNGGSLTETRGMAAAVQVLKEAACEKARLQQEAEQTRQMAEESRVQEDARSAEAAAQLASVLAAMEQGLHKLSEGDLTLRLDHTFPSEYEGLRSNFNNTVTRLADTVGSMATGTAAIQSGAAEITHAAGDLSRRTEQQAASLEQTAAALDEITVTVRSSAAGAEKALSVVSSAKSDADHGGLVVQDAVKAMDAIASSSNEIGQIIAVIDEIAFQTNLLALNAGVEAARAGDAGRGFAVVASEVRALAQRSAGAAREIKALISTSSDQVKRGVALVGDTGQALQRIVQQVGQIDVAVGEIAASAAEQASGLAQINSAMGQMDQVTQQNAAMVEQSTAASRNLAQEAETLAKLGAGFVIAAATAAAGKPALARLETTPAVRPTRSRPNGSQSGLPSQPKTVPGKRAVINKAVAAPSAAEDWEEF